MRQHSEHRKAGAALGGVAMLARASIRPGTRALVRVDWNVPLRRGRILDRGRIVATFPTLELLQRSGAEVTVATHLGYPRGRRVAGLRTAVLAPAMAGYRAKVRLLENLRFAEGEEANDPGFAASLAAGQDLFVNEAFSCLHRQHASIVGLPALLPGLLGPLAAREIEVLDGWRRVPVDERAIVVGGNKVADKLWLLAALAPKAAVVAVGGRVALPFLVAAGRMRRPRGLPAWELEAAAGLLAGRGDLLLPSDLVVHRPGTRWARTRDAPRRGERYADIGPATADEYAEAVRGCRAVLWSGPLGRYEEEPFQRGTARFLRMLGTARRAVLAGGGDTVAAARSAGLADQLAHLCTGGGAMLAELATGELPGVAALREHPYPMTEKAG